MRLFPQTRAAFALPDLLGLLVALAVAASLALAATRQMRQEAQHASSLSQLRWLAGATASYAADNQERFWTFSWEAGVLPHSDPALPSEAATDLIATSVQATDILRRLTGRTDITVASGWLPHVLFTHLPLVDYLGASLPEFKLIAPGDTHRLNWARDPEAFDRGEFLPYQPEPSDFSNRWPYSASYIVPTAWWDRENRVSQGTTHRTYTLPGLVELGGVAMHEVAYPSQKVMVHDQEQRELGGEGRYCVDSEVRTAMLMGDGSAGIRAAADANLGWNPTAPQSVAWMRFTYQPAAWEAGAATFVAGYYRWTRGGIEGRDFGGPEINTGQR